MENNMALATVEPEAEPTGPSRIWREMPITDDIIFRGKDEFGRAGWFVRITVSGLYPRRVGPYPTKKAALGVLEEFIAGVIQEPLCELEGDKTAQQAYVVEGVPALKSR